MKKNAKKIIFAVIAAVVLFVSIAIVINYIQSKTFGFNPKYIGTSLFLTGFVLAVYFVVTVLKKMDSSSAKKGGKAEDTVTDKKGKKVQQFYDKDFLADEDLKKIKGFNYNTLSSIRSCNKDGILVRAEQKGLGMDINFVKPIHTLVVGTTSSGKTTRFVVPSLQLMASTAAKPSFVITDPKGELYDINANKFKKEGYDVHVLNLRNPFQSVQWNPLTYPYDMYHRSFNLAKEVKVHSPGDNPDRYKLVKQTDFDYNTTTWFEFNNTAYADKQLLESDMRVIAKELRDTTYNALTDICQAIIPIQNEKDPSWEQTAQKMLQGIILAMLEDSRIPELGLTKDKFNFYNVAKIVNTQDSGRDTYATIKQYVFNYRDKFGQVAQLCNTGLNNAEGTTKNYVGFATAGVSMFNDSGIAFLTSNSELDFTKIDEKPTAVFLIIPDEIRTRYPLAILFVNQLYKRLVEKAAKIGGELKRHVYFMLDEFGNMPKFPQFGNYMAVGRSRGIFFELIVQSYSQLYQVYGQDEGKIIKDNCPIQVYIASEDTVTNKEFSELLGKKTIMITNENVSEGPDGKSTKSYSKQAQSIPIAYPEELMSFRDKEQILIKTFEPNAALKTKVTPYFKALSIYDNSKAPQVYAQRRALDEEKVFYDIKERNKYMAKQNGDDDDDDDDLF